MLVDKPAGPTSHDVVARARRALGTRSVGHTGTLDPFATGLLVLLVGRATRLARFVEAQPKTYLAGARLGRRTDTDDLTGSTLGEVVDAPAIPGTVVAEALAGFVGPQRQRPPAFSAKHVAGERSHRLARRGETVTLAEADVVVHGIELLEYRWPELRFRVTVSAGTYIRALARDLGERLGVGAHLASLRREAIGAILVDDAVPLDSLSTEAVRPARQVLAHLPAVDLDSAARAAVLHGRAVIAGEHGGGAAVALLADGELIAVAKEVDGWLRPAVVLGTP